MTFANDLESRLQKQRNRIHGMLMPGLRNEPGSANTSLSPVAPDFAGRKFQLAAKKMRVLSENRVNEFFSRSNFALSKDVLNKFRTIEKIIHINPKTIRDNSIWSKVETTFPGSSEGPFRETPQPEGGMLRQGSIIQKMRTVPSPGQSIQSFKKEIESQSRQVRRSAARTKKPTVSPGDRLFSRVQEIKPGQEKPGELVEAFEKLKEPAEPVEVSEKLKTPVAPAEAFEKLKAQVEPVKIPEKSKTPDESVKTHKKAKAVVEPKSKKADVTRISGQAVVQRQVDKKEDVQRQAANPEMVPKVKESPAKEEAMIAPPVVEQEVQEESEMQVDSGGKALLETSAKEEIVDIPEVHVDSLRQLSKKPETPEAKPLVKQKKTGSVLKKALPVKSKMQAEKLPVKRAHPAPKSTVQREADSKAQKVSLKQAKNLKPLGEARKPEQVAPKVEAATKKLGMDAETLSSEMPLEQAELAARPDLHQDLVVQKQKEVEVTSSEMRPAEPVMLAAEESAAAPEMPLQQAVVSRREATKSMIHRNEPAMKTKQARPLMPKFTVPMMAPRKVGSNVVSRQLADIPTASLAQPMASNSTGQAQILRAASSTQPTIIRESEEKTELPPELELALKKETPEAHPREIQSGDQKLSKPAPQRQTQAVSRAQSVTSGANVVQRMWKEHSELGSQGGGGAAASSQSSEGSDDGIEALDLEALAEDVLPYVKRILEVEADRGSRRYR